MSRSTIRKTAEQVWRDRAERAKERSGSITAFCKEEGVSSQALSYWRHKLRHAGRKRANKPAKTQAAASPFVGVEILEPVVTASGSPLPDAKWVAELVLHLLRGGLA